MLYRLKKKNYICICFSCQKLSTISSELSSRPTFPIVFYRKEKLIAKPAIWPKYICIFIEYRNKAINPPQHGKEEFFFLNFLHDCPYCHLHHRCHQCLQAEINLDNYSQINPFKARYSQL